MRNFHVSGRFTTSAKHYSWRDRDIREQQDWAEQQKRAEARLTAMKAAFASYAKDGVPRIEYVGTDLPGLVLSVSGGHLMAYGPLGDGPFAWTSTYTYRDWRKKHRLCDATREVKRLVVKELWEKFGAKNKRLRQEAQRAESAKKAQADYDRFRAGD